MNGKRDKPRTRALRGVAKVFAANDCLLLEGRFCFRVSFNEYPLLAFRIAAGMSMGAFPTGPLRLVGKTTDGRAMSAEPVYFSGSTIGSTKNETRFRATRVIIGDDRPCDRFELWFPNLLFTGTEFTEETTRDGGRSMSLDKFRATFTTEEGDVALEVKHVSGYKQIKTRIDKQRTREITAVGSLASTQGNLLKPHLAEKFGQQLSWLISFATGRLCGYTHLLGFSGNSLAFARYLDVPYGLKAGYVTVLPDLPGVLPGFLEQTYGGFCQNQVSKEGKYLVQAIASYVNSLALPTFPIPVYLTAYGLECLISGFLGANLTTFLKKPGRTKVANAFRRWAQHDVLPVIEERSQELAKEFKEMIPGKAGDVLRRSFSALLEALLKKFGIPYEQRYIRAFVKLRNAGIHGEFVPDEEFVNTWARATQWLELGILRLLGYGGEYVDRTDLGWAGQTKPLPWAASGVTK